MYHSEYGYGWRAAETRTKIPHTSSTRLLPMFQLLRLKVVIKGIDDISLLLEILLGGIGTAVTLSTISLFFCSSCFLECIEKKMHVVFQGLVSHL